jgi:hypothetical protein
MGWELTDDFVNILRTTNLDGARGYPECLRALLSTLETELRKSQKYGAYETAIARFLQGYRIWIDAIESV